MADVKEVAPKGKDTKSKGSTVRRCTCAHAWQDKTHGAGNRVHNSCLKGWRCTGCANVHVSN